MEITIAANTTCAHCGEPCTMARIRIGDHPFCCEGCKMVYQLLDASGLCEYYRLNEKPGIPQRNPVRLDKFAFLDDEKIAGKLIVFQNETETHVNFYLPLIHCSSCLYLLEHLPRLDPGVISCRVDFGVKEAAIIFDQRRITPKRLAELLASIGYEPYISLHDLDNPAPRDQKHLIYQLGVAGFCFANIMLISFPEYLGMDASDGHLQRVFRSVNLILSLPVILYGAQPFYHSAWKGIRRRFLNIDAPIVLAILIGFSRSAYEILSGAGAGYLDSVSGIIFFMLAGRVLQDRTYRHLSFERDYTSYFPVAVTALQKDKVSGRVQEISRVLPEIKCGDELLIHNEELIPADGILTRGKALIDYSFVTGESAPVIKEIGEIIYAGGRQKGAIIEMMVVKEVAQSYLTKLWNRQDNGKTGKPGKPGEPGEGGDAGDAAYAGLAKERAAGGSFSFVHLLSRYFTYILLGIAAATALFWWLHDPSKILSTVTAILIVACPCALFLSNTFTNGHILRLLGRNRLYLRNAEVIERIAATTHIVFDKTGTLTDTSRQGLTYEGIPLRAEERNGIATLAAQSMHPLSRMLARQLDSRERYSVTGFLEIPGKGLEGFIRGERIAIGSRSFVTGQLSSDESYHTRIYVSRDFILLGHFSPETRYRKGVAFLAKQLGRMRISVLSGDNEGERGRLVQLLGKDCHMLFGQTPSNKSRYIQRLQEAGEKVMMVGDGLNDAGALQQSDTGIALSENCNNFTPASDAILDSARLQQLPKFIRLCRINRRIVVASFILSILYNIIGLSFAVRGSLSPLTAAILMPSSSLSILLVTYAGSTLTARRLGL